jgi:hypothetical protein
MSKKLHAKDLKKDEFVETLGELWGPAFHWLQVNRKPLTWGIGGLLVVLLVAGAIGSLRQSSAERAQAALGEALEQLAEAESAAAGGEAADWDAVRAAFAEVADEHGGTPGEIARHYVGVAQLRAGDAAGAVATLSQAAGGSSDPWRTPLTLSVLAAAQEQAGDAASAEATLKDLRSRDALGFPADAATIELARFYERHGRLDEARELYGELAAELEDEEETSPSAYASQAQARLDELQG